MRKSAAVLLLFPLGREGHHFFFLPRQVNHCARASGAVDDPTKRAHRGQGRVENRGGFGGRMFSNVLFLAQGGVNRSSTFQLSSEGKLATAAA